MRARESALAIAAAIRIERVFYDVMALRADRMDEKLAGEFRQSETLPHRFAVDRDRRRTGRDVLGPFGDRFAAGIEQPQPKFKCAAAIARPVIRRDEPRRQTVLLAEEDEIGREVERVEIAPPTWHNALGQTERIEAQYRRAGRQQVPDMRYRALGIEAGHEDDTRARVFQRGHWLGGRSQHVPADCRHVLDETASEIEAAEIVKLGQSVDLALEVIDRATPFLEAAQQIGRRSGGERMGHRLEKSVAAAFVVERLDLEHCVAMT
jgi:hypothetical protein